MPKQFYSLGYNQSASANMKLVGLKINSLEYNYDEYEGVDFNLTSWWTPSLRTLIKCKFQIDCNAIFEDCMLSKTDLLSINLFSYCSGTKLQHQSETINVNGDEVEIELEIPENELADEFILNAIITTRFSETFNRKVGAPQVSNSKLLSKSWKFLLSGSRTQANIVLLDFSQTPARENAMWQIKIHSGSDIDSWLQAQHSNVLRIEVNKDFEDFIQQPIFQIPMMTDLVMLALDDAIRDDDKFDFLQNDSISDGTWAKFVKTMYSNIFTIGQIGVRQMWLENQDLIRARVQSLMSANLELK
jgi:hypothetical protein